MKNYFILIFCTALMFSNVYAQQDQSKFSKKGFKKIVFIAGPDSHGKGEHEHNGGSALLAKALNDSFPNVKAVVFKNGWPKDPAELNDADAIVLYGDGGGDHMAIPHLQNLDKVMKNGAGLVVLHFALEVPEGNAGNSFLNWIGGYFEINWSVNPVWKASFTSFPDHPVANGIKPFSITDEWYYHLRFAENRKGITPILQALPPESTLNRPDGTHSNNAAVKESVLVKKEPQTVAWTFERTNGGRGFGFSGGHIHKNWQDDNFRKVVLNAIAWTAKIDVPENGISSITSTQNELDDLSKKVN